MVGRGAVQVEAGYSTVRLAEESRHTLGEARVRYGLGLRSELRLNLNSFVLARDHGHAVAQLTTATALSLPLSHHVHTHAEYAAISTTDHWAERMHHVSGGLGFLLSEDLQLDLWTGGATHHGKKEFLFGAGFSRRW